jgi:hypothetical protein
MPDFSMCDNDKCPKRIHCLRFNSKPSPYPRWQSFSHFEFDEKTMKCEAFMDNFDEEFKKNKRKTKRSN